MTIRESLQKQLNDPRNVIVDVNKIQEKKFYSGREKVNGDKNLFVFIEEKYVPDEDDNPEEFITPYIMVLTTIHEDDIDRYENLYYIAGGKTTFPSLILRKVKNEPTI